MKKSLLFNCFVIAIAFLFFVPLCFAQDGAGEVFNTLAQSSKIIESDLVLDDFLDGRKTTRVIVTLSEPVSSPSNKDFRNLAIRDELKRAVQRVQEQVISRLDPDKIQITNRFVYIFGFSAEVTMEGLKEIEELDEVVSISKDRILEAHLSQGIPLMNASTVRNTHNGSGIAIAICDTGIDYTHTRLGGGTFPNSKVIGGHDCGDDDTDPMDAQGHGTCCAGIAAGNLGTVGDYIGGVAYNAKLYAVKISYGSGGSANTSDMIEGWEWCITHQNDNPANPIMIISTSFGSGYYTDNCDDASPAMTTAAANCVAAGITLFVSSGNDGYCDGMSWPACISHVNAIGAIYDADFGTYNPCVSQDSCATKYATVGCESGWYAIDETEPEMVTSYSNSASFLALFAPSNQAYTTDIVGSGGYDPGDYDSSFGGTSAACPYTAGAAACLQSAAQSINGSFLTPAEVKSTLTSTGDDITDGKIAITKPKVNLEAAVNALGSGLDNGPWPMFGHDVRHTGRSVYQVANVPILRWRHHIDGYVYSSSSIGSDGTIYVGNHDRTAYGWYEYLYAINPDGSLKWRYEMDPHVSITSTPAIGSDGTLYVGAWYYYTSYTPHGYLYAINPDGSLLWRYDVGECRVRTSPTIDSAGTIYFGADDEYLYAINPDGSLKWRYKAEGEVKSSAAIGSRGTIYVGSFDDYLYAINPDGTLLWRYKTDGDIKSSPAIDSSGTIYVGSFDDYLYAINHDGTLLWRYKTDGEIKSSPAIDSSGTIYVGSYDHYLYAFNPDGTIKWRYRTGDGIHSSPAIDSIGTIFVGSYDNYLYAINPDGTIKWRYRTDNDIHSSPSISSDGSVYIASHDYYFYAIGIPEGIGNELAVDFGSSGLWHYDGSTWNQLNGQNPEAMEEWNGGFASDFGTSGLWNYDGSSWNLLTTLDPEGMKTWDDGLAVDFSTTGLWNYNGSSWDLLTTNDPQDMESWTDGLAVDFGTFGLWNYDGSIWSLLTTSDSEDMAAWANGLAVDFGTFGLWSYNDSSWDLLTTSDAQSMEAWSGGLAVDFDTFGLWNYDGSSWGLLTTSDAEYMAAWANGLAVNFGGTGLWSYDGSSWDLLTTSDAQDMEGWATSLAVNLGASGLWSYDGSSWANLTGWDSEDMMDVDLY